jgi:hypothetical protein
MKILPVAFGAVLMQSCLCAAASPEPAPAAEQSAEAPAEARAFWRFYGSPLTVHFNPDPEHRAVYSLGVERQHPGGFLLGAGAFRNSFGQPSVYVYAGQRFDAPIASVPEFFLQVSAGVLYGYKEPYEDKVPFNHHGVSPGAVVAAGWMITPTFSAQINLLGDSALMLQFSFDLR